MDELPVVELPDLYHFVMNGLLGFCRIGGFMAAMPLFGNAAVPVRVRLSMALAITAAALPLVPNVADYTELSVALWLRLGGEVLIGLALGFSVQLFFHMFVLGAQIIAFQMGLGFASMNDPDNGVSVTVLGQAYLLLVSLLFLAMNGHLVLFQVLLGSFQVIPELSFEGFEGLVRLGSFMFGGALLIALPAVTALLLVNLGLGVVTRSAPQINIFSIGFPIMLVLGVAIVWVSLATIEDQFLDLVESFFDAFRILLI